MSLRVNWTKTLAVIVVLWSSTTWGATLTWDPNGEPDLAGYRVYQCSQQPCGRAFGTATPLATLGKVTSFDIGTPVVVQYFVVTAYDFANNESTESGVVTYTPTAPTPTPTPTSGFTVSPATLIYTGTVGGPNQPGSVTMTNTGTTALSVTWADSINWLVAIQPGVTQTIQPGQSGAYTFTVSTAGLAAGTYSGSATISGGGTTKSVPVMLTVTTSTSTSPTIGLSPMSLSFTDSVGGANPAAKTISIANTGGGTLTWSASDNTSWLTLSPASGSGNGTVAVNVNTAGLAPGTFNATITVTATSATPKTIPVALTVTQSTPTPTPTPTPAPPPAPTGLRFNSVN
jgi:hypothetical protein